MVIKFGYETFSENKHNREMKRAMRAMRGFSDLELVVNIGIPERDFLAAYAKLGDEDINNEAKLSAALLDLLHFVMELKTRKVESPAE